jgi:hypothetical protein
MKQLSPNKIKDVFSVWKQMRQIVKAYTLIHLFEIITLAQKVKTYRWATRLDI